jgi:hypothetical protein
LATDTRDLLTAVELRAMAKQATVLLRQDPTLVKAVLIDRRRRRGWRRDGWKPTDHVGKTAQVVVSHLLAKRDHGRKITPAFAKQK